MNKYHNRITVIDGIRFHSQKEAYKYEELKLSMKSQDPESVHTFQCQPKFVLQESFEKNDKKYGKITYIADFDVKYKNGTREIIDIKPFNQSTGKFYLTEMFRMKQKLFDYCYPDLILIIE